ncbi:hypothetical protein JI59_13810 [Novosphingobium pentaromativorans US6-1]|nr:hypothetical protein JI59_13810 [Novosphingobium pentaromativorans US6-1]
MKPDNATSPAWPKLSLAERDRRWARVRELMNQHDLEAIVVFGFGRDANDSYLTNEVEHGTVLFRREGEPLVLVGDVPLGRYDEAGARYERWTSQWRHGSPVVNLAKAVAEYGLEKSRIGVVGTSSRAVFQWAGVIPYKVWKAVMESLPDVEFVDIADAYETLTLFKSAEEMEMIRKAASIGEAACAAFVDACGEGVHESVVTAAAMHAIVANGGWFRAPFILERAGASRFGWGPPEWFHMGGEPHVLRKGDSIAAEVFAFYGGFESQQQIDVCIGEPDPLLRRLEQVCIESYEAGLKALRPGLRFSELAKIMEEPLLRAECWNTGPMVQTVSPVIFNSATRINPEVDPALSHLPALPIGVGLDGDFEIQPGVAFAFEPNALRDGKRVCIGGTVLLSENGVEDLNTISKRLVVVPA